MTDLRTLDEEEIATIWTEPSSSGARLSTGDPADETDPGDADETDPGDADGTDPGDADETDPGDSQDDDAGDDS